jgi:hypothetical protein
LYNTLSTQLNSTRQWNNVCWLLLRDINSLSLSYNFEVIDCIWTVKMWEHTHSHTECYSWTCSNVKRENQWNVENWYNLIENRELQFMFELSWVELSWQNSTEYCIVLCVSNKVYTREVWCLKISLFFLKRVDRFFTFSFVLISLFFSLFFLFNFLTFFRKFWREAFSSCWKRRFVCLWVKWRVSFVLNYKKKIS